MIQIFRYWTSCIHPTLAKSPLISSYSSKKCLAKIRVGCFSGGSRGGGLGQLRPQISVAPPWMVPLCHKCAPFWCTRKQKQILKYSQINNVFRLVEGQGLRAGLYPTSYRRAWTMLLFRNSSTVSFFLCRVRTAQAQPGLPGWPFGAKFQKFGPK